MKLHMYLVFQKEMEKCFSRYSTSSSEVKLRGHRRTGSITYNDVYWGQTIGFPLVHIYIIYVHLYVCACLCVCIYFNFLNEGFG